MSTAAPPRPDEPSVPKRRNTELALSLFAVAIAMFAYANVGLADNGKLPTGMWTLGAGLAAVVVVANLLIRYTAPYADPLFLPLAILLNGVGLVLIHRLDLWGAVYTKANPKDPQPSHATANQLMFTALGIVVLGGFLLLIKDHKVLQRYAYVSMVAGLVLVAIPALLPARYSSVNGAKSWIRFGGLSVQPAEFGKLLLVSFFAAYFMAKRDALRVASRKFVGLHIPRGRDLGPIAVCWVLAMLILIFETDLGVSLMFFGAFVVLLYIATERTSWLLFGLTAFMGGAVFIATTVPHVAARVTGWLHPFDAEIPGSRASNQLAQSMYGFASGGIFGKGLDQGRPYLVHFAANADFILVTVGEELGMIGLFALMMVYLLIVMRGFKTALLVRDNYGKLLAAGLSVTFALQVFITAGGVMRVIPLTGLPMPFLAAGGSALVANWVMIAALIRLSDAGRRPPPPAIPLTEQELRAMRLAVAVRQPSPPAVPAGGPAEVVPIGGPAGHPDPVDVPGAHAVTEAVPSRRPAYGEQTMIRAGELTEVVPPPTPSSADFETQLTPEPGEDTEAMAWEDDDASRYNYPQYGEATQFRAAEQTEVVAPASSQEDLGAAGGVETGAPPVEEQPPPPRRADRRYGP